MNIFTIFAPIIDFVLRFFLKKRNRPRLERPVPTSFLSKKNDSFFSLSPSPLFHRPKAKKNVFFLEKQEKVCIFAIERTKAKRQKAKDLCPLTLDL